MSSENVYPFKQVEENKNKLEAHLLRYERDYAKTQAGIEQLKNDVREMKDIDKEIRAEQKAQTSLLNKISESRSTGKMIIDKLMNFIVWGVGLILVWFVSQVVK